MSESKQKLGPRQLKWVEALESGKYTQGRGYLHFRDAYQYVGEREPVVTDKFCCLGIACDVFKEERKTQVEVSGDNVVMYDGSRTYPDLKMTTFLGLLSHKGKRMGYPKDLATYNDEGVTFQEIATMLREHPEEFFAEEI